MKKIIIAILLASLLFSCTTEKYATGYCPATRRMAGYGGGSK